MTLFIYFFWLKKGNLKTLLFFISQTKGFKLKKFHKNMVYLKKNIVFQMF